MWINNELPTVVDSFIIYRYLSWNSTNNIPQYLPIDTIKNDGKNIYYFKPTTELSKVVFFAVEAIPKDKVNYKTSSSNLTKVPWVDAPSNILLNYSIDTCNYVVILRWNSFRGWGTVSERLFRIEYQEDQNPVVYISINGSEFLKNDTTIEIPSAITSNFSFKNGSIYVFRVAEVNKIDGFTCYSNTITYYPNIPKAAKWINADGAMVTDNNNLQMTFTIDPDNELKKIVVLRSKYDSHDFSAIDTLELTSGNTLTYTDVNATDLNKNHYYYKSTIINNCGQDLGIESNVSSNIILSFDSANTIPSVKHALKWERYRYFRGDVKNYVLYRSRKSGTQIVGTTTGTTLLDDASGLLDNQVSDEICYQVEAVEEGNPYTVNGHAWSNKVCITIHAKIEMPKYLKLGKDCKSKAEEPYRFPQTTFRPSKFKMIIYDRWGTKVYDSDNVDEGWDGTYNGKVVPIGGYMYYIKYAGSDNIYNEQKGSFAVICSENK